MKSYGKPLTLYTIGGIAYYMVEMLYRGYSSWTMIIVGGLVFMLIGNINEHLSWKTLLWKQCGIATIIVLIVEFISGCIINLYFNMNIWDYSDLPYNLYGQICLYYSIIWYFLSIIAIILDDLLRWLLYKEKFEGYKIF